MYSGVECFVIGWVVPNILMEGSAFIIKSHMTLQRLMMQTRCLFEMPGTTDRMAERLIPQDLTYPTGPHFLQTMLWEPEILHFLLFFLWHFHLLWAVHQTCLHLSLSRLHLPPTQNVPSPPAAVLILLLVFLLLFLFNVSVQNFLLHSISVHSAMSTYRVTLLIIKLLVRYVDKILYVVDKKWCYSNITTSVLSPFFQIGTITDSLQCSGSSSLFQ